MQKQISIIGCGWLGLPLGAFLVEKGFSVKGSTTRKGKFPQLEAAGIKPFRIKAGKELKGDNLKDFFQSEILIINIPPGRKREDVAQKHPQEIQNIIDFAKAGKVEKIIFVSSTSVYADTNSIVTEKEDTEPSSPSGKALVEIESYLQFNIKLETTILRMSGLVGEDRKAGRFLAGKKQMPNGDAPVNLVHREDCIRVIYEVIRQGAWNEIYNVCSDHHPRRRRFYPAQAIKQGFEAPEFEEGGKASFKIISNKKLKKNLAYNFLHPNPMFF